METDYHQQLAPDHQDEQQRRHSLTLLYFSLVLTLLALTTLTFALCWHQTDAGDAVNVITLLMSLMMFCFAKMWMHNHSRGFIHSVILLTDYLWLLPSSVFGLSVFWTLMWFPSNLVFAVLVWLLPRRCINPAAAAAGI